jgi:thiol-disulfide isomerase/thioredoxin
MRRVLIACFAVLSATAFALAADDGPKAPADPKSKLVERAQTVKLEYEAAAAAFRAAQAAAKTAEEKQKADASYPSPIIFADRMLAIARANPGSEEAFQALSWIVERFGRSGPRLSEPQEAFRTLARDHAIDSRLQEACRAAGGSYRPAHEEFLRAVLAKNPNHAVKAAACYALAHSLSEKLRAKDFLIDFRETPNFEAIVKSMGSELVETLRGTDAHATTKEVEELYQRVIAEFADAKDHRGISLAERAKNALFERKSLNVGQVAPEIEGKDIEGVPFKLSDYRGKVVVLNFWGTWCGPCMVQIPHERDLVKRMEGKPFVLLGVNSDNDKEKLKERMREERITWRSWYDGPIATGGGPISRTWSIPGWPWFYVLDHKGVIRHKYILPGEEMDKAVDKLIKELEGTGQ